MEEAEWWGLDLNRACRKQQDLEDNAPAKPLKYHFVQQLMKELEEEGYSRQLALAEEDEKKSKEDDWGEWDEELKEREEQYKKTKWIGWRG